MSDYKPSDELVKVQRNPARGQGKIGGKLNYEK